MVEVAGVWDHVAEMVGRGERSLRCRRRFHKVDVHVDKARMAEGIGVRFKGLFKDFFRIQCAGVSIKLACLPIPQMLGGEVYQRIGVECYHIEVLGVALIDRFHCLDISFIIGCVVLLRDTAWETDPNGVDQCLFER